MLTPELAGRADLREGCPYGKAEKVHAGVPWGGGGAGAGYGSADRARGRGDRRGCATAGPLGPAGTRAARSASEPGDAFDGQEREELKQLRRRVHDLERDNEFLGKAAAFFASKPPGRNGSS